MTVNNNQSPWLVYILQCSDNSLYTGITTDLQRRVGEHNGVTKGARYTRSRQPVILVYSETCSNRSEAAKREWAIKHLSPERKRQLIKAADNNLSSTN